ncbi:MAG TPA: histidinol phosphate phosphatase domain-containing protein [Thermoplasmata archaeon]|nr:histidinol phosphate phosphatase domain-containing protein [Thermoplasmata archaeon]
MAPRTGTARRFDFHSHTYLTDGNESATSMWWAAARRGHRMLAITDHVALEDPRRILDILFAEAAAFEDGPVAPLVGVELTLLPPRRISETARNARSAGAQIVIVHGETTAESVPPGTNRAAVESGEVDVLAHPGFLTEREAETARANGTAIELSGRSLHGRTNGHVARTALSVGADLVVDSDAHDPNQLLDYPTAEMIARGAGLTPAQARRALRDAPSRLYQRLIRR